MNKFFAIALCWFSSSALAAVGYLHDAVGDVKAAQGSQQAQAAAKGAALENDMTISTGEKSHAVLKFDDGEVVALRSNTTFQIQDYHYDARDAEKSNMLFSMLRGGMRAITGLIGGQRRSAFRLRAPNATIGVRGTDFMVDMGGEDGRMFAQVTSGSIDLTNGAGTAAFDAGQTAVAASATALPSVIGAAALPAGIFSQLHEIPVPAPSGAESVPTSSIAQPEALPSPAGQVRGASDASLVGQANAPERLPIHRLQHKIPKKTAVPVRPLLAVQNIKAPDSSAGLRGASLGVSALPVGSAPFGAIAAPPLALAAGAAGSALMPSGSGAAQDTVQASPKAPARQLSRKQQFRNPQKAGAPAKSEVVGGGAATGMAAPSGGTLSLPGAAIAPVTAGIGAGSLLAQSGASSLPANATQEPASLGVLSLGGGAAASSGSQSSAAMQKAAGDADQSMQAPPASAMVQDEPTRKYQLAPIRWGGRISEAVGWGHDSHGKNTISNVQFLGLRASSYILKPYIAQWNGEVGLTSGTQGMHIDLSSGATTVTRSRYNTVTGFGVLSVFAQSRFPLSLSYRASDSRTDLNLVAEDQVSKSLSIKQNYRPLTGEDRYTLGYDRNSINTKSAGTNLSSLLDGFYTTKLGRQHDQPFSLHASHAQNSNSFGGYGSTNSVGAKHTYLPEDSLLSLESYVDLNDTSQQTSTYTLRSKYQQANIHGTWQPEEEDNPLVLTFGGRFFDATSNYSAANAAPVQGTTQSLSGNLGATYNTSRNTNLTAAATVAHVKNDSISKLISTESGSAVYRADATKFKGGSTYNWNVRGVLVNQTNSNAPSNQNLSLGFAHSLGVPYSFYLMDNRQDVNSSLGESLTAVHDRRDGQSSIFVNNGHVSWGIGRRDRLPSVTKDGSVKAGGTESLAATVSLSATDTRTTGKNASHYQTFTLGIGGGGQGGYNVSGYGASATVSVQASRQVSGATTVTGAAAATWAYTYSYNYKKRNVFDVRGLSYALRLSAGTNLASGATSDFSVGTQSSTQYQGVGAALFQSLAYQVGKNEAKLIAYVGRQNRDNQNGYGSSQYGASNPNAQNGRNYALVLAQLRAWRDFGA